MGASTASLATVLTPAVFAAPTAPAVTSAEAGAAAPGVAAVPAAAVVAPGATMLPAAAPAAVPAAVPAAAARAATPPTVEENMRNRPPQYEFVKRNVWGAGAKRPKRVPKDEIPVCNCTPPRQAVRPALPPELQPSAFRNGTSGAGSSGGTGATASGEGSSNSVAVGNNAPEKARTGCHGDCLNRLSYIHCDQRSCPCGELCSNR